MEKVFIAIPALDGMIRAELGYFQVLAERSAHQPGATREFRFRNLIGYSPIEYMRNVLVREFLRSDCDRVLMLDSDIIPPSQALEMLDLDAPIVAGLILGYKAGNLAGLRVLPCVYRTEGADVIPLEMPIESGSEVAAAGTGAMAVRREVFEDERLALGTPDRDGTPTIFRRPRHANGRASRTEDVDFCIRAAALGYRTRIWSQQTFGQREDLDLRDVARYGAHRAARGQ